MDAREKAKAGIWLLKQAVLDYLKSKDGGRALATDIRDDLGLRSEDTTGHESNLAWGVNILLRNDESVRTEKDGSRNWLVLN